jgi:hypothetical protein
MHTIVNSIKISKPNKYPKLSRRPATLYYLRIEFTHLTVYKIGYTTTSLAERVHGRPTSYSYKKVGKSVRRVRAAGHNGMGLPVGTKVYVVATLDHPNASYVYQVEQILHTRYALHRYKGEWLMENGNTELYTCDVLELDS